MAMLRPDPVFGSLPYRHRPLLRATNVGFAVACLLPLFATDASITVKVISILVSLAAVGFQLLPRVRPVDLVTTSPDGLTLRTLLGRRRLLVPWDQIESVVLWIQPRRSEADQPYIGVRQLAGAQPVVFESTSPRQDRFVESRLPPGVDMALAKASVTLGGFDPRRLADLLVACAPSVQVIDMRDGQEPRVVRPSLR